jgi:CheY-like chemotaxis protein
MYKILVVDDVVDNVLLLQTLLELEGYAVDTVDTGWGALALLETLRPDVVLLDVFLPDMLGYAVVERIRQNPNLFNTRVVLVTASSVLEEAEARASGADVFIRKPLDFDQLLAIVHQLCPAKPEM